MVVRTRPPCRPNPTANGVSTKFIAVTTSSYENPRSRWGRHSATNTHTASATTTISPRPVGPAREGTSSSRRCEPLRQPQSETAVYEHRRAAEQPRGREQAERRLEHRHRGAVHDASSVARRPTSGTTICLRIGPPATMSAAPPSIASAPSAPTQTNRRVSRLASRATSHRSAADIRNILARLAGA